MLPPYDCIHLPRLCTNLLIVRQTKPISLHKNVFICHVCSQIYSYFNTHIPTQNNTCQHKHTHIPTQTRGSGTLHERAECVESRDISTRALCDAWQEDVVYAFPLKPPKKGVLGASHELAAGERRWQRQILSIYYSNGP